jgi:CRP/FNR family cyclic AMP-dependent transcriptional regulator
MDRDAVAHALGLVPLFKTLRSGDLNRLAGLATVRGYRAGGTIVRQDDTAITLYCVLRGKVRVERQGAERPVVLAHLGPGGFFGEMSLLDDFPRSASVIAEEPTECALLSKWDLQRELKAHPQIGLAMLRVLSERIRVLDEQLSAL